MSQKHEHIPCKCAAYSHIYCIGKREQHMQYEDWTYPNLSEYAKKSEKFQS